MEGMATDKAKGKRKSREDEEARNARQREGHGATAAAAASRREGGGDRDGTWLDASRRDLPGFPHGRTMAPSGMTAPANESNEERVYPATGILRRAGPDVRRLSNIPDLPEPGPSATPTIQAVPTLTPTTTTTTMTPSYQLAASPAIPEGMNSNRQEYWTRTLPRSFDSSTGRAAPLDTRRAPLPSAFAQQAGSSSFPNPYATAKTEDKRQSSKPRTADIPPTPPLVQPTPAFGAGAPSRSAAPVQSPQRRALPVIPSGVPVAQISWATDPTSNRDEAEDDEESDENSRWSSGESTPTPTASSVAAASARRREAVRDLVPVPLLSPTSLGSSGPSRIPYTRSPAPFVQQPESKSSSSMRPLSSGSSLKLADGREVPTMRTDFSNMKRFSRPSSSSQPQSGLDGSQASKSRKQEVNQRDESPLPSNTRTPNAPKLQQDLRRFNKSDPAVATPEASRPGTGLEAAEGPVAPTDRPKRARDDLAALQTANRNTFGPDTQLFEQANQALLQLGSEKQKPQPKNSQVASILVSASDNPQFARERRQSEEAEEDRPRRPSNVESIRRSSFGSGTTALDTPNPEQRDSIDALYPLSNRRRSSSSQDDDTLPRKGATGLVSGLAAPPSDVPELVEPTKSETSSRHHRSQRRDKSGDGEGTTTDSYQGQWQPHQPMIVTTSNDPMRSPTRAPAGNSSSLRYIPIQNISTPAPVAAKAGQAAAGGGNTAARPQTGNSVTWRPGTGQTRFSAQSFRTRRLPSGHGNTPACRQCFRAGFDCAMNLQLGSGTGGRRAFQDFVNAGGLDAISIRTGGGQDQDDGASITVSQALGRNYVDKLGEVAFGESALSRPVTRGIVDDMLEERGRVLAEQQRGMSVENFLESLAKAKQEQDEEDEQREREAQRDRIGSEYVKREEVAAEDGEETKEGPKSSIMTRPRAATPSLVTAGMQPQTNLEIDPQDYASQDSSSSTSTLSDDLYFLADRWSIARKIWQLSILCVWVFVIQAIDSGYSASLEAMARDFATMPFSLLTGRLAYMWGEGGGLLLGSTFAVLGRQRVPIFSSLAMGAVAVIAGFARSAVLLTNLRGAMGLGAGIFQIMVLGSILDMMTTRRARCAAVMYLLAWGIAGQCAGPWITMLVIKLSSWRWLYWITTIAATVFAILAGSLTAETAHETCYRDKVLEVRRRPYHLYPPNQRGQQSRLQQERQEQERETPWMSEPRRLIRMRHYLRFYLGLPYLVAATHLLVVLCGLILAIFVGALVLVLTDLPQVLVTRHAFSDYLATVTISVCAAIGCLLAALGALLSLHWPSVAGKEAPSNRSRLLFIDEKGYIDTSRPAHRPEVFLRTALIGSLAAAVALYMLALTATTTNWIFGALSVVIACAGVALLALSIITYVFEAYHPAALAVLGEVIAEPDDLGPAPGLTGRQQPRSSSPSIVRREDECTLMSGADDSGKRWPVKWALYAVAAALNASFYIGGLMSLLAVFAQGLRFEILAVIAASASLGTCLLVVILFRYGSNLRHRTFARIAKKEQYIWLKTRRHTISTVPSLSRSGTQDFIERRRSSGQETVVPPQQQQRIRRESNPSGPLNAERSAPSKLRKLLLNPVKEYWRPTIARGNGDERTLEISSPVLQEARWEMVQHQTPGQSRSNLVPASALSAGLRSPSTPVNTRKQNNDERQTSPGWIRTTDANYEEDPYTPLPATKASSTLLPRHPAPAQMMTSHQNNSMPEWVSPRRRERQPSTGGIDLSPGQMQVPRVHPQWLTRPRDRSDTF